MAELSVSQTLAPRISPFPQGATCDNFGSIPLNVSSSEATKQRDCQSVIKVTGLEKASAIQKRAALDIASLCDVSYTDLDFWFQVRQVRPDQPEVTRAQLLAGDHFFGFIPNNKTERGAWYSTILDAGQLRKIRVGNPTIFGKFALPPRWECF